MAGLDTGMVTIRDTLRAALGADLVVSGLVGDRIYPAEIPDHDFPIPAIHYLVTEQETTDEIDASDHGSYTVEFDVFAQTYEQALDLRTAVRSVLYCFRGGQVDSCVYRSAAEETVEGGYAMRIVFGLRGVDASIVPDAPGRPRVSVVDGCLYLGEQRVGYGAASVITAGQLAGETAAVAAIAAALTAQGLITSTGDGMAASLPRVEVREDGLYFSDQKIIADVPPSLTYSRSAAGETAAVAAIRVALAEQGVILDLTNP